MKKRIFYFSIFYLLFFQFINQETFPDYSSYERIFNSFGIDFESDWEPFFVFLNFAFNKLNFSYDSFRFFILASSLVCVNFSLSNLRLVDSSKINNLNFFYQIILYFVFFITFFEFFVIRIRSGLAISFFILAFSFLFSKNKYRSVVYIFFFFLSSQTHLTTFMVLSFLLLIPYIVNKLRLNIFSLFIYFIISLIISALLLIRLDILVEDRGSHMYSGLNFFRFLLIAVVPTIIYFSSSFFMLIKRSFILKNLNNKIPLNLTTIHYISLSLSLIFLYPTGIIDYSGEAIVRIFTLSSIVFVLISNHIKIFTWNMWFYIGFINSVFFINTVFL